MRRAAPGTTLELAAGEYRLAQPLVLNKALTVQGAGLEQTRLVCEAEGAVLRCEGVGLVHVYDLTVEHRGEAWADVVVVAGGQVDIRRCRVTGGVWDEAHKRGGSGLSLYGQMRGTIAACQAQRNGLHGIQVTGEAQPHLEGNRCEANTWTGLGYFGQAGGQARGNVCHGNGSYGIAVQGKAQPHLEGNRCEANTQVGLGYWGQAGGQARGNVCHGNGSYGIAVQEEAQPHLEGNHCADNKRQNLYVAATAKPRLHGNQVD